MRHDPRFTRSFRRSPWVHAVHSLRPLVPRGRTRRERTQEERVNRVSERPWGKDDVSGPFSLTHHLRTGPSFPTSHSSPYSTGVSRVNDGTEGDERRET